MMLIKDKILPLADGYASTLFVGSEEARVALCDALDYADQEVETLKYKVDTWYERFMEAAKRCHELQAENAALRAKTFNMTQAIMDAYGILWNINTEPMAPIPMVDPERAAAKARLILKEMLCHEQRGIAINTARAAQPAEQTAPEQSEPDNDKVICPYCVTQFRAIPVNVQQLMLDAGFEPPFTAAPQPTELTDEEAGALFMKDLGADYLDDFVRGIRAAEQAHGIAAQKAKV